MGEISRSHLGIQHNYGKRLFRCCVFYCPKNQYSDENWPYRYDLWDILSMMLLGIALFKWKILSAEKSYKLYRLMAALGYLIGLTINYFETQSIVEANFSLLSFSKS